MDPPRCRNLRDQVARLLNIRLENGDQRVILLGEELLRDGAAFLAHAHLFRVLEQTLDILVAAPSRHVGHGQEGTGLRPRLGTIDLEPWLVADKRVGIDSRIVVSKALAGINQEFVDADGIDAGSIGDKIRRCVATRSYRLGIVRLDATQVITTVRHAIDVEIHLCQGSRKIKALQQRQ